MVARCHLPSHPYYKDYGGRGIKVCEGWRTNFNLFVLEMGPRPINYTLERKDNEAGYYKENCEWVSQAEQNRNQRRRQTALSDQIILEIFYSPFPPSFLARKYNIDKRTIYGIKHLAAGEYCSRLCKTYKLVAGNICLK